MDQTQHWGATTAGAKLERSSEAIGSAAPAYAFVANIVGVIIEYGRPQDQLSVLALIRPGLLLTVVFAACLLAHRHRIPWHDVKLKIFAAILVLMACWVPFARNNYFAFSTFQSFFQQFLFLLCAVTFVDTPVRLRRFMTCWVLILAYQACYGITHGGVSEGFMHDENDFSLVMNMAIPFAVLGFGGGRGFLPRTIAWGTPALFLAAIVVSMSRGGFVGLVAVSGTMILFSRRRVMMVGMVACAALVLNQFVPQEYRDEMRTISDQQDATAQERLYHWTLARRVWADNPILGVGQGNINWRMGEYQIEGEYKRSLAGRAVHSLYFTLLPELGLVGVFLYVCLLGSMLRELVYVIRSSGRDPTKAEYARYARAIACALSAYLACGVFISVAYYPHLPYLVAMTMVTRAVYDRLAGGEARAEAPGHPLASRT